MTSAVEARLDPDKLIEQACELAGSDDFGAEDGWRDNLSRVLDDFVAEADLSPLGVEIAAADIIVPLRNRLQITAWRTAHPEIAEQRIERPIFILGQPRTGTTILYDLLAQDPDLRAPLTWEVDHPFPVPQPETYETDPRIAETQAQLEMTEQLMPGFMKFHPMSARGGQECVRITGGTFCSMIFPTQYRMPNYQHWLMYEADHGAAYRYHRQYLQHLQSGVHGQWLLKSPAHLWTLDKLLVEYPDAILVQTHRDPLVVISSISALIAHLQKLASDNATVQRAAGQCAAENILGLDRLMTWADDGVIGSDRVINVRFADFMRDPFDTINLIYARLGRDLTPVAEQRMREHLSANPGDGGGNRYTWADTGLDAAELRDRVRAYQERYDVPSEPLR
ncbi:sulfotransferase family protein [Mycolicibacterium sphagni]|uniref:Sulfotransferase family protein n=1 Tax=Mycolicibacterium sphagni TaxID=1786 RepID=A0A255D926_9MYCO|nr:sulfotransferase [Mycolicibacterium sphagni]MCV7178640.1 sulfotransferase [Mycolicibacterium sphagni]OYN75927.1 sulfotransferase family protein [Mycolicibacterium sphagni]